MPDVLAPAPELEHFCDLTVELGPIREMGAGLAGQRRIIPILGGQVQGDRINGKVLGIGADWQTIFPSKVAELDTRYALETDDGAIIEIRNFGYRHGSDAVIAAVARGEHVSFDEYYMRTHARFETGDKRYDWINKMLFVGSGGRRKSSVEISIYAVV